MKLGCRITANATHIIVSPTQGEEGKRYIRNGQGVIFIAKGCDRLPERIGQAVLTCLNDPPTKAITVE